MSAAHRARWHSGAAPYAVAARTMADVLLSESVQHLDFFSLDVEGGELEVLQGFPWGDVPVGVLLFETLDACQDTSAACRKLLLERTPLRFAATCGRNAAGCSEVWCDPTYFRKHALFQAPPHSPPGRDGWLRASSRGRRETKDDTLPSPAI